MPDTSSPTNEQELLIRLDEKMTIWLDLFKEHKDSTRRDFDEVWRAITALRDEHAKLATAQNTASSERRGAGWLLNLVLALPGAGALLTILSGKVN